MKVAQFNTFPYGGAANAAIRIHRGLQQNQIDSRFYFHRNTKSPVNDPSFEQIEFAPSKYSVFTGPIQKRVDRRREKNTYQLYDNHLAQRPPNQETFSMAQLPAQTRLDWQTINADIAHLHWISFFADYPSFFGSIPSSVPLVWTLHDMNAFTGGCHYTNGCTGFKFGCGGCPQITNSGPQDVSYWTFKTKRNSLKKKNIHVVTPSDWMRQQAMSSNIWPAQTTFQTIRYGLDLKLFFPRNKKESRQKLGVDSDAVLIAFGAEDVNNKRKGFQHLLPALANLKTQNKVECLVFGSGEIEPAANVPRIHQMGYVDSVERQSLVYSAADIVVVPSREDNQPQVGLEAMACGTPVVGFDAGGIPEYVRDGATGLIANHGDEAHLADRLSCLVDNQGARVSMGEQARLMVEREFEITQQSQKYTEFYEALLEVKRRARAA